MPKSVPAKGTVLVAVAVSAVVATHGVTEVCVGRSRRPTATAAYFSEGVRGTPRGGHTCGRALVRTPKGFRAAVTSHLAETVCVRVKFGRWRVSPTFTAAADRHPRPRRDGPQRPRPPRRRRWTRPPRRRAPPRASMAVAGGGAGHRGARAQWQRGRRPGEPHGRGPPRRRDGGGSQDGHSEWVPPGCTRKHG